MRIIAINMEDGDEELLQELMELGFLQERERLRSYHLLWSLPYRFRD